MYVLVMVLMFANGGGATITQEFNSLTACERAREPMVTALKDKIQVLHGCFAKD